MTFVKRFIACSVCTVDLASTIGCNAVQRDYRTLYAQFVRLSTKIGIFIELFFNREVPWLVLESHSFHSTYMAWIFSAKRYIK